MEISQLLINNNLWFTMNIPIQLFYCQTKTDQTHLQMIVNWLICDQRNFGFNIWVVWNVVFAFYFFLIISIIRFSNACVNVYGFYYQSIMTWIIVVFRVDVNHLNIIIMLNVLLTYWNEVAKCLMFNYYSGNITKMCSILWFHLTYSNRKTF